MLKGGNMSNEEKAESLVSNLYLMVCKFVMLIKENANKGLCSKEEWDRYIEVSFNRFFKILCDELMPGVDNPYTNDKDDKNKIKTIYKAVPYEEALLRAQLNAKPMTDELREQVFLRIIKPKFIEYLSQKKNNEK